MPVLVAVTVGGLLVLAVYAGAGVLALAVVGAQAVLAYGLTGTREQPGRERAGALVALAGIAAVVALWLAKPEPTGPTIAPALWVLGPAVVLALLRELARRDGRERLVESLATTVTGVAFAGLVALLVPLESLEPTRHVGVVFAVSGAVLGVGVWWLATAGRGRWRGVGVVLAVAVLAATAVVLLTVTVQELARDQQLALGGVVAVTGMVGAGTGHQLGRDRVSRVCLMSVLGLALAGPAAYFTVRVLFW